MLEILGTVPAPSGDEQYIKKFIKTKLPGAYEDEIGNLIFHKENNGEKLMVFVNIDEDAFVVMSKKDGKIFFTHLGERKVTSGMTVSFGGYKGIILTDNKEKNDEDLYIEMIGNANVEVGTIGTFDADYFAEDNSVFLKEAASRIAINAMINSKDTISKYNTYFVFGVLGKKNNKGLINASRLIAPDKTIIFEESDKKSEKLVLKLMEKGYILNGNMAEFFEEFEEGFEKEVNSEGKSAGTFADLKNLAVVGIPVKYTDNQRQEASINFVEKTEKLIKYVMEN